MLLARAHERITRGPGAHLGDAPLDLAPLRLHGMKALDDLAGGGRLERARLLVGYQLGEQPIDVRLEVVSLRAGKLELHCHLRAASHGSGVVDDGRVALHLQEAREQKRRADNPDGDAGERHPRSREDQGPFFREATPPHRATSCILPRPRPEHYRTLYPERTLTR